MEQEHNRQLMLQKAARITRTLLFLFAVYVGFVASVLAFVWNMPRRMIPVSAEYCEPLMFALQVHGVMLLVCGTGLLLLRHRKHVRPWLPKVLTSAIVVGLVISLDTGLGLVFLPPSRAGNLTVFELHPVRGWTTRRDCRGYFSGVPFRTDHHGLRVDFDEGPVDFANKKRVLFIGDSITHGYSHRARDVYAYQAIRLLNERHSDASLVLLNGGINGYDSAQEFHWLKHNGLMLEPDLVVLQFCFNDVTARYDPTSGSRIARHVEYALAKRPVSRSGIRRAITAMVCRLRFGEDPQATAAKIEHFELQELLLENPPERVEQAWRISLGQISGCVRTCREAGLPMLLICFPIPDQMITFGASTRPQQILAAFSEREKVPYLDLLPVYRSRFGVGKEASKAAFQDTTHPTISGNLAAGEAVATFLEESGLLDEVLGARSPQVEREK